MSRQTRLILKEYFQKGKVPTQQQFEDLIDSFFNLTDDKRDETSLFFFTPQAVLKDSGDASLGWKSTGVDKVTLEYVSGGERKLVEEGLPLQCEKYDVTGIDETACFTLTGYAADKLIAQQQLWITGGIGYDTIGIDFHVK